VHLTPDFGSWYHESLRNEAGPRLRRWFVESNSQNIDAVLQDPRLSLTIGTAAGISAVVCWRAVSKEHGAHVRGALRSLYLDSVPSIYVCGGASLGAGVLCSAQRLHPGESTWETLSPMPTARRLCAGASTGGYVYVFGGESFMKSNHTFVHEFFSMLQDEYTVGKTFVQLPDAERFNTFDGTWETLPPMPTPRAGCCASSYKGMLYVCGGRNQDIVTGVVERFDPPTWQWERIPRLPTARSGCSAATLDGLVYVLGGKGIDRNALPASECLDSTLGRWWVLPHMSTARSALAVGAVGGLLFAAGGFDGLSALETCEVFDPAVGAWSMLPSMSTPRVGGAAAASCGKLYVFGGAGSHPRDEVHVHEYFDPSTQKWHKLPDMWLQQVYCAGAAAYAP